MVKSVLLTHCGPDSRCRTVIQGPPIIITIVTSNIPRPRRLRLIC